MRYRYLSYPIAGVIPTYGNPFTNLNIEKVKSIYKGDSCDTYMFRMGNHWGTHIDTPAHFFPGGKSITDYTAGECVFNKPYILEINLKINEIVEVPMVTELLDKEADIVLIKSGFYSIRGKEEYCFNNPGVSPKIGLWLRQECPSIRAIGFDFISISSFSRKDIGREAHRAFLNPTEKGNPIFIIEDMDLSCNLEGLEMVFVSPLRVSGIDSVPCTVIGAFRD